MSMLGKCQYSARKFLDIAVIPSEVKDETLEESFVEIFDKIGCSINSDWIEACHQVSKNNNTVTVNFTRRKDCQRVCNKNKLNNYKMEDFGLHGQRKIFLNSCLCVYYKMFYK